MTTVTQSGLNTLSPSVGSTHRRKRVARGCGSGRGKTAGRGHKGQLSRSGKTIKPWFEGGQMPLIRRLPKRGFRSRTERCWVRLPTAVLTSLPVGQQVTPALLEKCGFLGHSQDRIKIFLSGDVTRNYQLSGIAVSAGARVAIEAAGGSVSKAEPSVAPQEDGQPTVVAPDTEKDPSDRSSS